MERWGGDHDTKHATCLHKCLFHADMAGGAVRRVLLPTGRAIPCIGNFQLRLLGLLGLFMHLGCLVLLVWCEEERPTHSLLKHLWTISVGQQCCKLQVLALAQRGSSVAVMAQHQSCARRL